MNNHKKLASRLSYGHERPDLFGSTPIYGKAPRMTLGFEKNRCLLHAKQLRDTDKSESERRRELEAFKTKRRGSQMVKKDRPQPVAKPSPQMAYGPDSSAFSATWDNEHRNARRAKRLAEAKTIRSELHDHIDYLDQETRHVETKKNQGRNGHASIGEKEAFKIRRRVQVESQRVISKAKEFQRNAG